MQARSRLAVLLVPPGLWMIVLFAAPLVAMLLLSFRAATGSLSWGAWTLANYSNFLSNYAYQRLLAGSTLIAALTATLAIVLAYPLAHYLAFAAGERRLVLLTLLVLPAWTSYLLRIFAWRLMLGSNGLINSLLLWLGLIHEALPILLYSPAAVVVTLVYVWIPFATLPIFAALERVDRGLIEAASDLGAGPRAVFWRVILPLSLPGVLSSFIFVFIPSLGEYVTPMLVGGAQGIMYGNVIQDQFLRALNWPVGSLLSVVMLLLALVVLALLSRFVRLSEALRV